MFENPVLVTEHSESPELTGATLRTRVQVMLRDAILDGDFVAGQKLIERELCDLTGASRSILREVLVSLESRGLVECQSYRGYNVTRMSVNKVCEIFELRATLETRAAELFSERASDQEIIDLQNALAELENCLVVFDLRIMRLIKERYYEVLFSGCRNEEIGRALENVIDRVHYLRSQLMLDPSRRKTSLAEMRQLTSALAARDRVAARVASLAHIEAARIAALDGMAPGDLGQFSSRTS